jgi:group II intron reverse transcriptase/maturase
VKPTIADRAEKVDSHNSAMHEGEKSDGSVVPKKHSNNAEQFAAESAEGRDPALENSAKQNTPRTQSRTRVSSALGRIQQIAKSRPADRFTALLHHINPERLEDAYRSLKANASPGIDGLTWQEYGEDLERNLTGLYKRIHRGAYRAKPTRRAYIPKADGKQRPLGIAALEDKILQRAVAEVLTAIYEVDFLGFSYGFRPKRSAHSALDALAYTIRWKKVNYILDADIRGFFDSINHEWMMKFAAHRIADPRVLRLIQKWLTAGVMEGEEWKASELGTPQGATISPLLANLYLHHVLDLWADNWRKRNARGEVIIVRYADDFVVGFENEEEGKRFLADLQTRMMKFGLELHGEKTRLIEFGRHAVERCQRERGRKPATFDFLGFTHICTKSRKGNFLLTRHTMAKRLRTKLKEVKEGLHHRDDHPIPEQGAWLRRVIQGYFQYFAVPTNSQALNSFRFQVTRLWYRRLNRRSQKSRLTWARMRRLANQWLPIPTVKHPWPDERFLVKINARAQCGKSARWDLCGG